jgi:hypothetical protein
MMGENYRMKNRIIAAFVAALALFSASGAGAIQQANVPPKFALTWGAFAATPYIRSIPQPSQIGITNCSASLTDGFPPLTFVPAAAGGCAPFGQDFNGILRQITQWDQWTSAGGPTFYDATFATGAANGYPKGAILQSTIVPGDFWLSTADNNTSNPDTGGTNWVPLPSTYQTGSIAWTWTTVPSGWVNLNASTTIGNASSGATVANSTTQLLYVLLWNNCSNTQCPVTGGRGANAAADYAANKQIAVFSMAGSMQIGNDQGTGVLNGLPVIFGSGPNFNLSLVGEVFHTNAVGELPAHTHNINITSSIESAAHTHTGSGTTGNDSPDHFHSVEGFGGGGANVAGGGSFNNSSVNTSGANTRHQHAYSFTTSTESANHTHVVNGATDGGNGLFNTPANNTPRAMVGIWMIKL